MCGVGLCAIHSAVESGSSPMVALVIEERTRSNGLQPKSGLRPTSDGLQLIRKKQQILDMESIEYLKKNNIF